MKILLVCGNSHGNRNLQAVGDALRSSAGVQLSFGSLRVREGREISIELHDLDSLDSSSALSWFYGKRPLARALALVRLRPVLTGLERFDAVVFFHFGALERMIAHRMKVRWSSAILLVQDAMLLDPAGRGFRDWVKRLVYRGKIHLSLCERVFVSGQATRDTLVRQGVEPKRVLITGIPRYAHVQAWRTKADFSKIPRVLFLAGAHQWHGGRRSEDLAARNAMIELASGLAEVEDVTICYRPHPRSLLGDEAQTARNMGATLVEDGQFDDEVGRADFIVTCQYPSSVQFEALASGRAMLIWNRRGDLDHLSVPCPLDRILSNVNGGEHLAQLVRGEERMAVLSQRDLDYFVVVHDNAADQIAGEVLGLAVDAQVVGINENVAS